MLRATLVILWPSFVAAGIGISIIFTLIDPMELVVLGEHIRASRTTIYSLGFFIIWAIAALAAALTSFLQLGRNPGPRELGGGGNGADRSCPP
ncbi:MAG: hypothetical protein LW838_08325 [Nitrosomonadaceae bacterium]|jgi:hypothetical protein|nr:hypothetical protein [Nitrosomonadaceae bacterium]